MNKTIVCSRLQLYGVNGSFSWADWTWTSWRFSSHRHWFLFLLWPRSSHCCERTVLIRPFGRLVRRRFDRLVAWVSKCYFNSTLDFKLNLIFVEYFHRFFCFRFNKFMLHLRLLCLIVSRVNWINVPLVSFSLHLLNHHTITMLYLYGVLRNS